jgi:ligand-binding sensor domain-containing protein
VLLVVHLFCALLLFHVPEAFTQRLSFRHYDIRDGLAHNRVGCIHQDRKGYIWFGTWEGLSRFDGYRFTNYGMRDGLSNPLINAIAEDHQGHLWVATNVGGVARLIDDPKESSVLQKEEPGSSPRRKFVSYSIATAPGANIVDTLLFDPSDNLCR